MADDSASQGAYLPRLLRRGALLATAGCAFVAGCGSTGGGETRYDSSPQFKGGVFQNMAKGTAGTQACKATAFNNHDAQ